MRRLLLPGFVVAALAIALLPSAAFAVTVPSPPYAANADCLACHAVQNAGPVVNTVDFDVPPVDRGTVCAKCHWIGDPAVTPHPFHNTENACRICHGTDWGSPNYAASVAGPGGTWFRTASSAATDAASLHRIHLAARWPANVRVNAGSTLYGPPVQQTSVCGSCHAAAACSACHEGVAPDVHGDHTYDAAAGSRTATPVPAVVAAGTPVGDQSVDSRSSSQVTCLASNCHNPSAFGIPKTYAADSGELVLSGNWLQYSGGSPPLTAPYGLCSNTFGSEIAINGVSGSSITWRGFRLYNGGYGELLVDGVVVGSASSAGSYTGSEVFLAVPLVPGSHTVAIRVSGIPGAYGGTIVAFDSLVVSQDPVPFVPSCVSCHATRSAAHGYETIDHVADETATVESALGKPCGDCHSMDMSTAHAAVSISNGSGPAISGCAICHSPLPGKPVTAEGTINPDHTVTSPSRWSQTCEACHNAGNPVIGADKHRHMSMHSLSGDALANNQKCFTCHPAAGPGVVDLPTVHAAAETTVPIRGVPTRLSGCDVCHKNPTLGRDSNGLLPNGCATCHFTFEAHPKNHGSSYNLSSCNNAGCHTATETVDPSTNTSVTTADLVVIHNEHAPGGSFACGNCHESADTKVTAAIAAGDKACDACHAGVSAAMPHRDLHPAVPALTDSGGSHYAYVTGSSAGGAYTADCALCHTSNLVDEHLGIVLDGSVVRPARKKADGSPLDCASCHVSLRPEVGAAIAQGLTNCDACHVVHDEIPTAHATAYTASPDPAVPCGSCHACDLTSIHAGRAATTPAGLTLAGCALCHDYTTDQGPMGAAVQSAIDSGDTLCAACHSSYHTQAPASHLATTPASVSGCGMCHDEANAGAGIDVTALHSAVTTPGVCVVCHANSPRVPDVTQKTAECASCHATQGTDYHAGYQAAHVAPGPASCFTCHKTADALALHSSPAEGACAVCHANPGKGDLTAGKTSTACDGCHANEGLDFHADQGARHASPTNGTCFGAGCHSVSKSLPDVHALYVGAGSESPQYATTCELCHLNEDPNRIDWTNATAACTGVCHAGTTHQGMSAGHTLTAASDECVGCHGTSGIAAIHKADPYAGGTFDNCARCHNNPSRGGDLAGNKPNADCVQCHVTAGGDFHASQDASHTFDAMPAGCAASGCHPSNRLPEVHQAYVGPGSPNPAYPTTCRLCHANSDPGRIDWATATANCSSCHPPVDTGTPHVGVHATTSDSVGCLRCHTIGSGQDVATLHAARAEGKCAVCHANPSRGDMTQGKTSADCAGCHAGYDASTGAGHSNLPGVHQSPTVTASCEGAGCHSADLPATHDPFVSRYPAFADSCALCHDNPQRIPDISQKTAACDSCHDVGPTGHVGAHVATDAVTMGCEGCHAIPSGGDIASLHASATYGPCNTCHANPDKGGDLTMSGGVRKPTAACAQSGCHPAKDPYDPNHYPSMPHGAVDSLTVEPSIGTACGTCHYMDLKAEHIAKATSTMSDGTRVTCVKCHTSAQFAALPSDGTPRGRSWSPKACEKCHTTKHGEMAVKHDLSAIRPECAGSACHATADVAPLHANATVSVSGSVLSGCAVCHQSPTTVPARDCATCHPAASSGHKAEHDTIGIDAGCGGCHFSGNLIDEHITSGLKGTNGQALTCASCHDSANAAVKSAIATRNTACDACHPAVNGRNRHQSQWASEFVPTNASAHRVNAALPAARTSFVVNGATYTWSLPSSFLKSPWTTSSIVSCADCHNFGTNPAGPHGSSVTVLMDPAWAGDWHSGRLSSSGGSPSNLICNKCHTNLRNSNKVHGEGDHSGYYCVDCHAGIPHGWRLPRMLAYTTDPAPYASGHLAAIKLKSYSPTNWSESDCGQSGCREHNSTVSPKWPSVEGGALPSPSSNVAEGKDFSASASGGGAASNAGDGSYSTYWGSGSVTYRNRTQWLKVDLGEPTEVSKVVVGWNNQSYYARSYSVQTSTDNANWTTVYSTTSGSSSNSTITFPAVSARYVRVYCTNNNTSGGYRVYELEVWTP